MGRLRAGIAAAARAYLAAGAAEVYPPVAAGEPLRTAGDCAAFAARRLSASDLHAPLCGASLRGRRDGGAARRWPLRRSAARCSVCAGLYVVDAASLPSNTGVNPQITIMANALRIAAGVIAEARTAV
jgi:hypothetical protein